MVCMIRITRTDVHFKKNSVIFLQALKKDESNPEISEFASMLLKEYSFPVMMTVIAPNGTIVHKTNANTFLDMEVSFLESG